MKRILFFILIATLAQNAIAQPARRRTQQNQTQKQGNNAMSTRAQISFPTQAPMSEDVVWRRDIYREIDLTNEKNAGLYYPVEPLGTQMNLFTYLFKLIMTGQVKAYEYRLDGMEMFNDSARVKPMNILKDHKIAYERTARGIHIDDSSIPSEQVKGYLLKESAYYDQANSSFHTKVQALCPVVLLTDDFGDSGKSPMFWVKYDDIAPFLSKQTIMTSNLNNAATMSMDDYFTKNMYDGKIYKTTNMLGLTLSQYCDGDTAKISAEQKRIEKEIAAFESHMWGDKAVKDSLDSIAKLDPRDVRAAEKAAAKAEKKDRRAGTSTAKAPTVKKTRTTRTSSASRGSARVSVRRERH